MTLPSPMAPLSPLKKSLEMSHSKSRHDATDVAVTIRAPMPNNRNDAANAGIRASITRCMFLSMVSPQWICGDVDMNSFCDIVFSYLTFFFARRNQSSRGLRDGHVL